MVSFSSEVYALVEDEVLEALRYGTDLPESLPVPVYRMRGGNGSVAGDDSDSSSTSSSKEEGGSHGQEKKMSEGSRKDETDAAPPQGGDTDTPQQDGSDDEEHKGHDPTSLQDEVDDVLPGNVEGSVKKIYRSRQFELVIFLHTQYVKATREERELTEAQLRQRPRMTTAQSYKVTFSEQFLAGLIERIGTDASSSPLCLEETQNKRTEAAAKAWFEEWIERCSHTLEQGESRSPPPLNLESFSSKMFITWLTSLKNKGRWWGPGFYKGRRAAVFDLFRDSGAKKSKQFTKSIGRCLADINKRIAKQKEDFGEPLEEDDVAMPFELYQRLCRWFVEDGSKTAIFARCFLTLTWNLLCPLSSTDQICREHVELCDDCLSVMLAHVKTDRAGCVTSFRRHVYANPKNWIICAHNALAIFLIANPDGDDDMATGLLFRGGSAFARFSDILKRTLKDHEQSVAEMGIRIEDIGNDSICKGAVTYCCNGNTDSPSLPSVYHRAGWSMGKVKDMHIEYDPAGDQRVGRTVAGLDVNSVEFAVSPPIYIQQSMSQRDADACKRTDRELFFSNVPTRWLGVATLLTATIVYSRDNMMKTFPPGTKELLIPTVVLPSDPRAAKVDVVYPFNNTAPDGTVLIAHKGLPNATLMLNQLHEIAEHVRRSNEKMDNLNDNLEDRVANKVRTMLDARGAGGGNISMDELRAAVDSQFQARFRSTILDSPLLTNLQRIAENLQVHAQAVGGNEQADDQDETHERQLYEWTEHPERLKKKLPESFDLRLLQNLSPLTLWTAWHNGLHTHRFALKEVAFTDVPRHKYTLDTAKVERFGEAEASRKRREGDRALFNKLRKLCERLDEAAGIDPESQPPPSHRELSRLYSSKDAVRNMLPPRKTSTNRSRRVSELTWVTVETYAQKTDMQKRRRLEVQAGGQAD